MIKINFFFKDAGPPPPPLPPPLRAPSHVNYTNSIPIPPSPTDDQRDNDDGSDDADSDSGFEVIEEPTLKPSELVRGNHNRTMSTISGM